MNKIKYFFQFLIIIILFSLFKILGIKISSYIGGKLFEFIGPFFRSKELIDKNIRRAFPNIDQDRLTSINSSMWNNYGRVFAEYMFIKDYRNNNLKNNIIIEGDEILKDLKKKNKKVIFISGHFSNFELMAMHIEKSGIDLAAIYRPLNNKFLNPIMEKIRKKYICHKQVKKGVSGVKEIVKYFKSGTSVALMIDQRVSQGIKSLLFKNEALTTTIPAQFIKKFNCKIVPIYIERIDDVNFTLTINNSIKYSNEHSIKDITLDLNQRIEKMILNRPEQWIWSHNRWK